MKAIGFPLETKRLIIRLFTPEDTEALHTIFGDPEVMKRIPSGPSPSLEVTRQRLQKIMKLQEERGFSLWALEEKRAHVLVGNCGLFPVEGKGPEIELSYDIARAFWNQGYATEAAGECLRYGLNHLKLKRIIAITYPDHFASRRVMEKIGMTYEGTVRYYDRDLVQYSKTI